jgi:hypothetical protein
MEWISIKNKKPKEEQEIVAVNDFQKEVVGEAFYEDGVCCCGNGDEMISHVVFWFPKPELPSFNWR